MSEVKRTCDVWGSHRCADEELLLPGYDALSIGKELLTFQSSVLALSSGFFQKLVTTTTTQEKQHQILLFIPCIVDYQFTTLDKQNGQYTFTNIYII